MFFFLASLLSTERGNERRLIVVLLHLYCTNLTNLSYYYFFLEAVTHLLYRLFLLRRDDTRDIQMIKYIWDFFSMTACCICGGECQPRMTEGSVNSVPRRTK